MPKWKEWTETIVDPKSGKEKEVKFYRVRGKPEGREVQKIFRSDKHKAAWTQADNQKREWDKRERIRRGEEPSDEPVDARELISFNDVAEMFLDGRRALELGKATLHDYEQAIENHLRPWLDKRKKLNDIRAITEIVMENFVDDLTRGVLKSKKEGKAADKPLGLVAKRKLLMLMKKVLRYAKKKRFIAEVPGEKLFIEAPSSHRTKKAKTRETRVWQFNQVWSMLRAADRLQHDRDARRRKAWSSGGYRALVYLMCFSGLRISEAIAVRFENLHLDARNPYIRVWEGVDRYRTLGEPKNDAAVRKVMLHRGVVKVLRDYIAAAGLQDAGPDDLLFSTDDGKPMSPRNVHARCWTVMVNEVNRAAKDPAFADERYVQIKGTGTAWHGLRRFVNSAMERSDIERAALQRFMGHSSDRMTRHYLFTLDDLFDLSDLLADADAEDAAEEVVA